ncbi:MAG: hypothetical protein HYU57_09440 [Micavibrio aeruginosavorus]|nr:hypothetical protein [Micavibrio aeruginosavorus]
MLQSMTVPSLKKAFAVAALGVLSGCATVCTTPICRLEDTARSMLSNDDVGIKATGARTLIGIHPKLAEESAEVRRAMLPQTVSCTVTKVNVANGEKVVACEGKAPAPAPAN